MFVLTIQNIESCCENIKHKYIDKEQGLLDMESNEKNKILDLLIETIENSYGKNIKTLIMYATEETQKHQQFWTFFDLLTARLVVLKKHPFVLVKNI
jgi:hypothetical protein